MSDKKPIGFQIKGITFPRIDSVFIGTPINIEFETGHRVNGVVTSDTNLRLLFGIRLVSKEVVEGKPKVRITVEAIAEFEFQEALPKIENVKDLPLAGNLLALIYPFIREKIHYCLSNNNFQMFVSPINTIQLIQDTAPSPSFSVVDTRNIAAQVGS